MFYLLMTAVYKNTVKMIDMIKSTNLAKMSTVINKLSRLSSCLLNRNMVRLYTSPWSVSTLTMLRALLCIYFFSEQKNHRLFLFCLNRAHNLCRDTRLCPPASAVLSYMLQFDFKLLRNFLGIV